MRSRLIILSLALLLAGCSGGALADAPTPTSVEATAAPTRTPRPTMQPTAEPTQVPQPTPEPTALPTQVTQEVERGEGIIYLDADAVTIKRIRPDGSDPQTIFSIPKPEDAVVNTVSANSDGSLVMYGLYSQERGGQYYLVGNGQVSEVGQSAQVPRWSPDETRLLGLEYAGEFAYMRLFVYDIATGSKTVMPFNASAPDWLNNTQIIHVRMPETNEGAMLTDLYRYDLETDGGSPLTLLPYEGDEAWVIQDVRVLPDGNHIIFYGGQLKNLGASGNGSQWWYISVRGGDPKPFTDPNGAGIVAYDSSPRGGYIAYAEYVHSGACTSEDVLVFNAGDVLGGIAAIPPLPEFYERANDFLTRTNGVGWATDGARLAFGLEVFTCGSPGDEPSVERREIYVWDTREGGNTITPFKIDKVADGAFPNWVE